MILIKNQFKKGMAFCLAAAFMVGISATAFAASSSDTAASDTTAPSVQRSQKQEGQARSGKGSAGVNVIEIAASVLGKDTDEIKESVKTGKVGDLLVAAGKVDEFKTAYLAKAKEQLGVAVTAGTMTKAEADEKYAVQQAKMEAYDGSAHLCGGSDHSKMFEKKDKTKTSSTSDQAA